MFLERTLRNSRIFFSSFVSNLPIKSQEVVQDGKRNSLASSIGLF